MLKTGSAALVALMLAFGTCEATSPGFAAAQEAPAPSGPAVTVTRDGDVWTAEYEMDRDAPVWAFFRSSLISETRLP